MFILVNVMVGIGMNTYNNPFDTNTNVILLEANYLESYQNTTSSEEAVWGSAQSDGNRQFETHIGNPLTWGWGVLKTFYRVLAPWSLWHLNFENAVTKLMVNILTLFRGLMMLLVGMEAYMFYINKKTS